MEQTQVSAPQAPRPSLGPTDQAAPAHEPAAAAKPGSGAGLAPRRGPTRPRFPAPGPAASTDARRAMLSEIRRFAHGEPGAGASLPRPDGSWLPAALYPFRHQEIIRQDYPLFVLAQPGVPARCASLSDLLAEVVCAFAKGEDDARALKDNLARLEVEIRRAAETAGQTVDASSVFAAGADSLLESLSLKGRSADALKEDLARFLGALPRGGVLIAMSEQTSVQLCLHAARAVAEHRLGTLRAAARQLRGRLRDLLAMERARGAVGRTEKSLADSVGEIGVAHLDPAALSRLLSKSGATPATDTARAERLGHTIAALDRFLEDDRPALVHVVGPGAAPGWLPATGAEWRTAGENACAEAADAFDSLAGALAPVFAAIRTGRLELEGAYDDARHASMARSLDWRSFSRDELLLMPPVIAIESAEALAGPALVALSRLILSGRPVNVLAHVAVAGDPGADPLQRYRFELAYLGVSHREALVNQATAARPAHLLAGFVRGMEATHTALHVVTSSLTTSGQEPLLGAWLHGGAALEARAHPLFHYDPEAGDTWSRRLDFSVNPSPEEDWPAYEVACDSASGKPAPLRGRFTFADFSLLEDAYLDQFRVIPDDLECDTLLDAATYLDMQPEAALDKTPFIWAADGDGVLHRLAFTRRLGFACRDRLDYWHTLQELSGVRNEHVREAVERERERLAALFDAERKTLAAEHAGEVDRVRREAAGEAMQRLAAALVSADLASFAAGAVAAPGAPARPAIAPGAPAEAPPPQAAAPPVAEEERVAIEEPYIDSALCTSCNDCTNLNPRLFVYNSNKQAVIGDPKAGTFAELVAAAEKCPARCIHPGKPLNPAEPGLPGLIERAKPFN